MPTLLNLVPNSAKVMATSGVATIRLILRVRRLIPRATSPAPSYYFTLLCDFLPAAHSLPSAHPHHHQQLRLQISGSQAVIGPQCLNDVAES